jgi:hypothetical protein
MTCIREKLIKVEKGNIKAKTNMISIKIEVMNHVEKCISF